MSRDCVNCKHYIWDMDRKYKACELWECKDVVEKEKRRNAARNIGTDRKERTNG